VRKKSQFGRKKSQFATVLPLGLLRWNACLAQSAHHPSHSLRLPGAPTLSTTHHQANATHTNIANTREATLLVYTPHPVISLVTLHSYRCAHCFFGVVLSCLASHRIAAFRTSNTECGASGDQPSLASCCAQTCQLGQQECPSSSLPSKPRATSTTPTSETPPTNDIHTLLVEQDGPRATSTQRP
jgi:hypothetical protein